MLRDLIFNTWGQFRHQYIQISAHVNFIMNLAKVGQDFLLNNWVEL